MKIILKELSLVNFQGVRNETFTFTELTKVSGDNETGKSTLNNAWTWLITGKDLFGSAVFDLKTIKDDVVIPRIDHVVSADIRGLFRVFYPLGRRPC